MLIIGENIHIIAPPVKAAIEARDAKAIQAMALRQVEAGAGVLDLNIGPQKKLGHEVMPWIVEAVQEVTDTPLSLDTTNLAAMEAGLKVCERPAMLNSASADPARLDSVMQLAARYGARVIALTMGVDGIPTTADGRAGIAMEALLPAAEAAGLPIADVFLDPLVLTVTCNQDVARESVEAIRMFKMMADPPPTTVVGLSQHLQRLPARDRPLINRTMLVMLMGAGLDSAIADPLDDGAERVHPHRGAARREHADGQARRGSVRRERRHGGARRGLVDESDPRQVDLYKTYRMLQNEVIYADSYLRI